MRYPWTFGHDAEVTALAVSPHSAMCATGSKDGTIILWNMHSGLPAREWVGHPSSVRCLAFSPESGRLASSSSGIDGVIIWDVDTNEELSKLPWRKEPILTSVWAPDGTTIAAGTYLQSILVWDTTTRYGRRWYQPFCDNHAIKVLRYSPDSRFLASGHTNKFFLWNARTGKRVSEQNCAVPEDAVMDIAFDCRTERLATGSHRGMLDTWTIGSDISSSLSLHGMGGVQRVSFSPDGSLVSILDNGTSVVWTTYDGRSSVCSSDVPGLAIAVGPLGHVVASARADGSVALWSLRERQVLHTFRESSAPMMHILFSEDGKTLCCGASDGTVHIRRVPLLGLTSRV